MPDTVKDTTAKPSAKQVYCLAHLMIDLLQLDWPNDRGSASDLIGALRAQRDAIVTNPAGSLVPDASAVSAAADAEIPF